MTIDMFIFICFVYDLFTEDKFFSILLSITSCDQGLIFQVVNILYVYLYERFIF